VLLDTSVPSDLFDSGRCPIAICWRHEMVERHGYQVTVGHLSEEHARPKIAVAMDRVSPRVQRREPQLLVGHLPDLEVGSLISRETNVR
jgi:hypothetical protein